MEQVETQRNNRAVTQLGYVPLSRLGNIGQREHRWIATFPLALGVWVEVPPVSSWSTAGTWSTKQGVERVFSDTIATALAAMRKSHSI